MSTSFVQRSVLLAAVFTAACSPSDDNAARVTIDMRCGTSADCPRGFSCEAETEHGPPTTMCESEDPAASCPHEYETHVGYGQVFCIPSPAARSHGSAISRAARMPHDATSQAEPARTR